jgi:glycosyltransferase involved in cell wall biosynthesis
MTRHEDPGAGAPDVSFVMPCYNEESIVEYTVRKLTGAFRTAGYRFELVAVDNGSSDKTSEILRRLASEIPGVVYHRVEVNQGYGFGVTSGFPLCRAPWVGYIPADGQVDAEDVVRLFEAVSVATDPVVGKVRRRFRTDGLMRKIVSVSYNVLIRVLWPGLGSIDVNGTPKLLPRNILLALDLKSKDWFLDPELMIKAHVLGVRTLEFNAFGRLRGNGLSHVRAGACWEFFRNLLYYRFNSEWRKDLKAPLPNNASKPVGMATPQLEQR